MPRPSRTDALTGCESKKRIGAAVKREISRGKFCRRHDYLDKNPRETRVGPVLRPFVSASRSFYRGEVRVAHSRRFRTPRTEGQKGEIS